MRLRSRPLVVDSNDLLSPGQYRGRESQQLDLSGVNETNAGWNDKFYTTKTKPPGTLDLPSCC